MRSITVPRTEPITSPPPAGRVFPTPAGHPPARPPSSHLRGEGRAPQVAARKGEGVGRVGRLRDLAEVEQPRHHHLHRGLVGATVARHRQLHLVGAVQRDGNTHPRGRHEREPARLADRHRGANVGLEQHALHRDRRRPRVGDQRTQLVVEREEPERQRVVGGSPDDAAPERTGLVVLPCDDAVAATRQPRVDAQDRAGRIEHRFDARGWMRAGRGSRPAPEQAPDHEEHDHAGDDRQQSPGRRVARHVEQVDRLRVGRLDQPGTGGRRGRSVGARGRVVADDGRGRPRLRFRPAFDSTSRSRFSTNWRSSFDDTSSSTPRPNCATLPVIERSVTTSTRCRRLPRSS